MGEVLDKEEEEIMKLESTEEPSAKQYRENEAKNIKKEEYDEEFKILKTKEMQDNARAVNLKMLTFKSERVDTLNKDVDDELGEDPPFEDTTGKDEYIQALSSVI